MNTSLFFEGPVRSGKSTVLRQALLPYLPMLGGFVVQRLLASDGAPVAYRLISLEEIKNGGEAGKSLFMEVDAPYPTAGLNGDFADESDIFLWVSPRRIDFTVFETKGMACLRQSSTDKLLLLDEIGGVDLLCPLFCDSLRTVLQGETPCLGVIKEIEKARNAQSFNGELRTFLSIQTLSPENLSSAPSMIQAFINSVDA